MSLKRKGSLQLLLLFQIHRRQISDGLCQNFGAKLLTVVSFLALFSGRGLSAEIPVVTYDADLTLQYIDRLGGPRTALGENNADRNTIRNRTLGLRHLKLGSRFSILGDSELALVFRPDALTNRGLLVDRRAVEPDDDSFQDDDTKREFESRISPPYREQPRIVFLDSYSISYLAGTNLRLGAGVYSQLQFPLYPYTSPLQFGLHLPFPEKFSGVEVFWRNSGDKPVGVVRPQSLFWFSLHVLQGHDDRGEFLSEDDDGFDKAPAGEDPYLGIALKTGVDFSNRLKLGFLGGFYDTKTDTGKRSDAFYNLVLNAELPALGSGRPQFGLGIEYQNLSWNFVADRKVSPLDRLAVSALFSLGIGRNDVVVGGYYGNGEYYRPTLQQATDVRGFQVEVGYRRELATHLKLSLFVTQENRRMKQDGKESGGFVGTAGNSAGLVRRMLVGIEYQISGGPL